MPIIGATEIQPVNILGSYMSGLEMGRANRLAQQQARQAQQASLEDQELRNALAGGLDIATPEGQAQLFRFGAPGVALAEKGANIGASRALTGEREASTLKTQTERDVAIRNLANENYGRFQKALGDMAFSDSPLTKQNVLVNLRAMIQQGIVAPQMEQFAASTLPDNPDELRMALRDQFLTQIPPVERANLFVPMSPEVFEQQRALRAAGAARSSTPPSELKYSQTLGEASANEDMAALKAADAAAADLTNDYRAIELLRSGKPATGITADVELQFNRLKAAVGQDKKALEKVTSTELLNALLGQDVFKNIQALGIGARGLDTPAEREYLREVVSGTISLNQQTLIKMAEIRAAIKERAIDKFNKRVESGELDRFFEAAGRPKRTIEKPSAPTAPATAGKSYPTEAAAEAAFKAGKLKVGDRVTIGGVSGTWK